MGASKGQGAHTEGGPRGSRIHQRGLGRGSFATLITEGTFPCLEVVSESLGHVWREDREGSRWPQLAKPLPSAHCLLPFSSQPSSKHHPHSRLPGLLLPLLRPRRPPVLKSQHHGACVAAAVPQAGIPWETHLPAGS